MPGTTAGSSQWKTIDMMPSDRSRPTAMDSLSMLLELAGMPQSLHERVAIEGSTIVFPVKYRAVDAAAALLAANGIAAAELWKARGGQDQEVRVTGKAAALAMRSSRYLRIDGVKPPSDERLTGFYRLRDGRWMYLHCNFLNLQARNCAVLGVPENRQAVTEAVARWDGLELEEKIFAGGGVCAFVRSESEWNALPQMHAMSKLPVLEILKIGDAPVQPLPPADRPLSGIRVLDLTRVLAGPTAGRTLAEHGADVLRIIREDLPDLYPSDFDTSVGKLCAHLDLRDPQQARRMQELLRTCDVFSQSYRPGALARFGLSPEALARSRPGIVYLTLSAWGHEGPWAMRRGYETVLQAANGMAWKPDNAQPEFVPLAAQDYLSGYLLSFGAMVALARRAREGGSWLVRVALGRSGHWIREHGLLDPSEYAHLPAELPAGELEQLMQHHDSPVGRMSNLAPAVSMSKTPARWVRPSVPRGFHAAEWPRPERQ